MRSAFNTRRGVQKILSTCRRLLSSPIFNAQLNRPSSQRRHWYWATHHRRCRRGSLHVSVLGSSGRHLKRTITIQVRQLSNPGVQDLLHVSAQELGYSHGGTLRIACSDEALDAALRCNSLRAVRERRFERTYS